MDEFIHEFTHLMTNPAHLLVEGIFVGIDYLIIHTVVRHWRKHFHNPELHPNEMCNENMY